ncbi:phosphotransferase [Pseudoalteromonas denitrificans]|uniref:Choline/ethanolamine kinase n=1 Tax=Pseudoalteromonas denitrificans DSM 6059 TaxID=1123010 RepID=A0A1I1JYY2_9GAMM|nr:phosphotransferase [Pseudoalteromonas denitrificans]SFC53907.1 Choline/ethanolamine kinase [Pseudoalteromonas denitrificans DSM 6059]
MANEISLFNHFRPQEKILKSIFLSNGLSNMNYHIITDKQHYLLKCYRNRLPLEQLNAQNELAKIGIAPKVYGFNPMTNAALFDYIAGETASHISISSIVVPLVQLHQFPSDSACLNLSTHFLLYQDLAEYKVFEQKINRVLALIEALPKNLGFCHNDLVMANIINNTNGFIMIDFEYAQNNDIFFDLAAVSSSYQLNKKQKLRLLKLYFEYSGLSMTKESAFKKLSLFSFIYNVLCYFWYIGEGYKEAAKLALSQLHNCNFNK